MESIQRGAETASQGLKTALTIDTEKVRSHVEEVVRSTVEQTLNQMLDEEADRVAGAGRYERSAERADTRAGSYSRKLQTKAGEVTLKVPRLRNWPGTPTPKNASSSTTRVEGALPEGALPVTLTP